MIIKHRDYFKMYEPIGCPDSDTVELFHGHGVEASFEAALTRIHQRRDGIFPIDRRRFRLWSSAPAASLPRPRRRGTR